MGGSIRDKSVIGHRKKYPNATVLYEDDVWIKKREWLEQHRIVVMRCHDVWDEFREIGIHGAWAKRLGFTGRPLQTVTYYEVHDVSNRTLGEVATQLSQHCEFLGQ